MSEVKKEMNVQDAIELSLREKKTVELCDLDEKQEIALGAACDTSCVNESTVDYWGMREGDEWHVCVIKERKR